MHSKIAIAAFLSLVAAVPHEADVWEEVARIDQRAVATSTAAACKVTPATACTKLPDGHGPTPASDTVTDFRAYDGFFESAANAVTPPNYVRSFQDWDASSNASNYITSSNLQRYDPADCAAKCDANKNCIAFNLYFERDPSLSPDGICCPNPKSITNIKCALWGSYLTSTTASNKGQWREKFQIIIAGSNGYNKIKAALTTTPTTLATAAATTKLMSAITTAQLSDTIPTTSNTPNVFPGSSTTATMPTSASTGCASPVATPVITFYLNRTTVWGENLFMAGNIPQLGNWDFDNSYAMSSYKYTLSNPKWYAMLQLAAGTSFEYKYFQRNLNYSITWALDPNDRYTVPTGCESQIVVEDQWH